MTNKEMRKKGCSSLQKKNLIASKCYSFRCASVDPWDGSNVVLGQLTKRALDQSSYVMLQCTYQIVCCRFRGTNMSQGVRTRDDEMCLKAKSEMSHIIFKKNHNLKFPILKKNYFKELN